MQPTTRPPHAYFLIGRLRAPILTALLLLGGCSSAVDHDAFNALVGKPIAPIVKALGAPDQFLGDAAQGHYLFHNTVDLPELETEHTPFTVTSSDFSTSSSGFISTQAIAYHPHSCTLTLQVAHGIVTAQHAEGDAKGCSIYEKALQ